MLNDFGIENGELVKYHGSDAHVVIPDGVTEIGAEAFADGSSLTSIVIPNSVTKIGWDVFKGCTSLTSIVIPDSVSKIRDHAFSCCDHLTVICSPGSCAWQYCMENGIPVKAPGKTEPEDKRTKRPGLFRRLFGKKKG